MSQLPSAHNLLPSGEPAGFAARPASTAWETVALADSPAQSIWVWFKPPNMPQALVIKLSAGALPNTSQPPSFTMRRLLDAVAIEPASVANWYLGGMSYEGLKGTSPYFDQPISAASLVAAEIVVSIDPGYVETVPVVDVDLSGVGAERILDVIAADWEATIKMERQMLVIRKQLAAMMGRLNALNRDLSPEESAQSDRQDKNEWRDARRWLRESAARLSRCIKEHDVGDTSLAGKRVWFEQTYRQRIVPRQQFDGLEDAHREFQAYRKRFQTVLQTMTAAYATAAQDGERRAQQILGRIATKVRAARSKKPPTAKGRGGSGI